jgi:hypothetical protein
MHKKILAFLVALPMMAFLMGATSAAEDLSPIPKTSDHWRFTVVPYVWAPGINGTLNFADGLVKTADYSNSNVLSNLKTGGMIAGEAHYGNWGVMGDLISATLQNTGATPIVVPTRADGTVRATLADKVTLQQTILTGAATYTVANNKNLYLDGLLGVRAIYTTATLNLALDGGKHKASDSKTTSTLDPIVGFKGRYRLAQSTWYVPLYADIGGGGGTTNLTWQAMLGVGKTFNKLVDVSLTYRALYYDMNNGGVLQKTTMQGPQLAVSLNF